MLKRLMPVLVQLSVQIFLYFMPFSATLLLLIFLVLLVSVRGGLFSDLCPVTTNCGTWNDSWCFSFHHRINFHSFFFVSWCCWMVLFFFVVCLGHECTVQGICEHSFHVRPLKFTTLNNTLFKQRHCLRFVQNEHLEGHAKWRLIQNHNKYRNTFNVTGWQIKNQHFDEQILFKIVLIWLYYDKNRRFSAFKNAHSTLKKLVKCKISPTPVGHHKIPYSDV